jgi:plastocyanin
MNIILRYLLLIFISSYSLSLFAMPIIQVEIRDHLFYPAEIEIPPNTKVKLVFLNRDSTAEEIESSELNREKVISGNSQGLLFIGPLEVGEYPFAGEFFHKTAQGKIIVK